MSMEAKAEQERLGRELIEFILHAADELTSDPMWRPMTADQLQSAIEQIVGEIRIERPSAEKK